jgi:alcohol dehydrogenase
LTQWIVPNLHNILTNWVKWFPQNPLPKLPAIFGLDPAGVVEVVGAQVYDFKVGDRVYVNPGRHCGSCWARRAGNTIACTAYTFNGYFGFPPKSPRMFEDYPYGGLCEYIPHRNTAWSNCRTTSVLKPPHAWVTWATAYKTLLKANVGPGTTVLINGISGTLGLGAVALALAVGVRKILGTARNQDLFQKVKDLDAPGRIEIHTEASRSLGVVESALRRWVNQLQQERNGVTPQSKALTPGDSNETGRCLSGSIAVEGHSYFRSCRAAMDYGVSKENLHSRLDAKSSVIRQLLPTSPGQRSPQFDGKISHRLFQCIGHTNSPIAGQRRTVLRSGN